MKAKYHLLLVSSAALIMSCGNNAGHQHHEEAAKDSVAAMPANESKPEALRLDANDAKWKVNAEMMVPLTKMEAAINKSNGSTSEEMVALSKELQVNLDELVSSCTMDGESHDVLHTWLHPFMELVSAIQQGEQPGTPAEQLGELKHSMETFHQYFQ